MSNDPDWTALEQMPLLSWQPRQKLKLASTRVSRSAVPALDVHNHLGRWLSGDNSIHDRWSYNPEAPWVVPDVGALVALMDEHNVETTVNLDGMWDRELEENLQRYDAAYPGRFLTFCQLDWHALAEPGGEKSLAESLRRSAATGSRGLKVWKNLGLAVRDSSGKVVLPGDPRVVELLGLAGELGLPVLIHIADPMAFFDPVDPHNERFDELLQERDWWFGDHDRYPTFAELIEGLDLLVRSTPETRYIGAHVGCAAEDLDWVEGLLSRADNFNIEIGGRLAEIGRQPRRFLRLLERFPDRVLFGTDVYPPSAEVYQVHFRFLETEDEAFDYRPGFEVPPQGRWVISALGLERTELEAVYRGNAQRVLDLPA